MIKMTKRNIIVAAVAVLLGGGGLIYALSGPSQEEKNLVEAEIRLRAGISQGVTLDRYLQLLAEVRTRLDLARPKMGSVAVASLEYKISRADAAGHVWESMIQGSCETLYEYSGQSDTSMCMSMIDEEMKLLKLANDREALDKLLKSVFSSKDMIRSVLTVVGKDLDNDIPGHQ